MQCLIVADNDQRRAMLRTAAIESGWKAMACVDSAQATIETRRSVYHLVIVDLIGETESTPAGYREFCEQLASEGDVLLMICGREGDPLEEIWARQFGAWLYLPGVDAFCDVKMLCDEAQKAVEKRHPELAQGDSSADTYFQTA